MEPYNPVIIYALIVGGFLLHPLLMWVYSPALAYRALAERQSANKFILPSLFLLGLVIALWPIYFLMGVVDSAPLVGWYIGILLSAAILSCMSQEGWNVKLFMNKMYLAMMFTIPFLGYVAGEKL